MSSQSESPYWSQLLSIVAIIIACWWLPGSVMSAQLRMWLSGSLSPMLSNEGNPLTSISRWSSLAPASTSHILRTLLAHISRHLVNSHWTFCQSIFGLCKGTPNTPLRSPFQSSGATRKPIQYYVVILGLTPIIPRALCCHPAPFPCSDPGYQCRDAKTL